MSTTTQTAVAGGIVATTVAGTVAAILSFSGPTITNPVEQLHNTIVKVCPDIIGVSLDGTIWYKPGATCQAAAQVAMQQALIKGN